MIILIFVIGLIIGSFLNVCIYRIPRKKSIIYPPSNCPNCRTPLKYYDLVPVFSYIIQNRKCRYCGMIIPPQYLIVELLNGLLYMILYIKLGLTMDFVFYTIIFSLLIIISFIDLEYKIIPNFLNILILTLSILYKILGSLIYNISPSFIKSLLGLLISSSVFIIIILISKGGMGGGDMKLIGALGFILGSKKILLNIVLAFIIGGIISMFLLLFKIKDRKDSIPFGPFISLAFIITIIWGPEIINCYT